LYNWAGATNGENGSIDDQGEAVYDVAYEKVQGVCPDGWHLPSDMEWSDLEQAIADAVAGIYSTDGTVSLESDFRTTAAWRGTSQGQKMKSTTKVNNQVTNGSSFSAATAGFNALLVGEVYDVDDVGSFRDDFGMRASFWSSSSYSNIYAYGRILLHGDTGVDRFCYGYRSNLFSVRCKKDN
jgi:uncharacterized protein (TIGR02145 family)